MDKHDIAKILDEIALLLEIQGDNPFKIRAYERAARSIENLDADIHEVIKKGSLRDIPGIGEKIAEKIETLVKTGKLPYYIDLKASIPKGVLEFLKIPGLGAKKAKILYDKLGLKSIEELKKAAQKNLIADLPGFGEKSQKKILDSLDKLLSYNKRHLWWDAESIAEPILEGLKKLKEVDRVEVAGSFRRKLETVGDLDFLVATKKPKAVMDFFTTQKWVSEVLNKGEAKSSIRLKNGMQADLRVIPDKSYPFAELYFTGSKEHNIKLRERALSMGYHLNEYSLDPLKIKPKAEKDVYQALKLSYIPPELREDMGEIEAAAVGKLPKLIEEKDILGAFHCHTTYSDGHNTLEEMVKRADELNWAYIGIADHSKSSFQANGMQLDRLEEQLAAIKKLNLSGKYKAHIFAGLECDIMTNGKLDFADSVLKELDYVIVSIHRSFTLSQKDQTKRLIKAIENPYTTMVAHPTGRLLLKREPYAIDIDKVIDACIANNKIMELNGNPMRLDLDWRYWHKASQKGLKCAINPDAHSVHDLEYVRAGVNIARKGWLEKKHVVNSLPLDQIKKLLNQKGL